ncbi:MAG TPA: M20/M25/M40 family metallo-hydrolase [Nitrospiria bacterium]|nr:M20/M25/M40 family metallo-hydrolase [Nitrospiria bacterium]
MIRAERMSAAFLELVRIDSLSREEGKIAERLVRELKALGSEVYVDDAGSKVGGETGNIIARFPGGRTGEPVLLSAHMDTVVPGRGIKPIREPDRIRTDGTTILGADDKSGIAIILEVLTVLNEREIPHPPVEVVFTICEEAGLIGAKHLDIRSLRSRHGLVLDSCPADSLFTRGPAADKLEFTVHGHAAHAGVCPEEGLNAIRIAAEAIARMRLGRIDAETTANLGLIEGGSAVNIVPDRVVIRGEARSHDEAKLAAQSSHMAECFETAARAHRLMKDGREIQARVEGKIERDYPRMTLGDDAPVVQWIKAAAATLGVSIACRKTGGGCDANVFNGHGLNVANLGTGMREIHTVKEHLLLREFEQTARVVLEMLRAV